MTTREGSGGFEVRIPTPDQIIMGDDGTGHCAGCGISLDQFDTDCDICMIALAAVHGDLK